MRAPSPWRHGSATSLSGLRLRPAARISKYEPISLTFNFRRSSSGLRAAYRDGKFRSSHMNARMDAFARSRCTCSHPRSARHLLEYLARRETAVDTARPDHV